MTSHITNREAVLLARNVARRLNKELREQVSCKYRNGKLLLSLSTAYFEQKFGILLQQIHELIDRYFPSRMADVILEIIDTTKKYRVNLKIWNTAVSG